MNKRERAELQAKWDEGRRRDDAVFQRFFLDELPPLPEPNALMQPGALEDVASEFRRGHSLSDLYLSRVAHVPANSSWRTRAFGRKHPRTSREDAGGSWQTPAFFQKHVTLQEHIRSAGRLLVAAGVALDVPTEPLLQYLSCCSDSERNNLHDAAFAAAQKICDAAAVKQIVSSIGRPGSAQCAVQDDPSSANPGDTALPVVEQPAPAKDMNKPGEVMEAPNEADKAHPAVVDRSAATSKNAGANGKRRGRLPKDESEAKRSIFLAKLREHSSLKDDPAMVAKMVGISEATARRWINDEEQSYLECRAAQPDDGEDCED